MGLTYFLKLLKDRVVVWIVENGISSRVFEHHLSCISVATTDLAIPNLYCYVINLDALKRAKVPKQDRRLFLFECTDLLQDTEKNLNNFINKTDRCSITIRRNFLHPC